MKALCPLLLFLTLAVAVVLADPTPVSICDIQTYNGVSPGDRVIVTGVCTGETGRYGAQNTIITEEGGGPWCSIWVFVNNQDLDAERGECVTVVGEVQEYYDKTELYVADDESIRPLVEADCFPAPGPMWVTTDAADTEPYEACLVVVWCATVLEDPDSFGLFPLDDGSGPVYAVLQPAWPQPVTGDFYCRMAGIMDYSWDTFRLRPRDQDEIDETEEEDCEYCDYTATPTPFFSATPAPPTATAPPASPSPSETPTPTGGPTSPTPSPTPTPPAGMKCSLALSLNQSYFIPGDLFHLAVELTPLEAVLSERLFVVLDVYGTYFFHPAWSTELTYEQLNYPMTALPTGILSFTWPPGAGAAGNLAFYAATLNSAFNLSSNLEFVTFAYGEAF
ncbi:hypothetical protein JW905_06175 [bacterium]|nr:hypothetical protein [candidate division CSSED10-310 bacterium]